MTDDGGYDWSIPNGTSQEEKAGDWQASEHGRCVLFSSGIDYGDYYMPTKALLMLFVSQWRKRKGEWSCCLRSPIFHIQENLTNVRPTSRPTTALDMVSKGFRVKILHESRRHLAHPYANLSRRRMLGIRFNSQDHVYLLLYLLSATLSQVTASTSKSNSTRSTFSQFVLLVFLPL